LVYFRQLIGIFQALHVRLHWKRGRDSHDNKTTCFW